MSLLKKCVALTAALALGASLSLVGCGSSTETTDETTDATDQVKLVTAGKLTIGSDCDYPPFISLDGETPVGFEVDLMSAVAEELGLELNYLSPQKFDTLIASVASGTSMDVAVSSFTINDERKETVDFSDSYYDSNQSVVVMKDSGYTQVSDLEGKAVGAQAGTTGLDWAEENVADITMSPFDDATTAFAALQAGKVEAVFLDLPVAIELVKTTYTDAEVIAEIPTGEQYGIAVSKDNPELTKQINAALTTLRENGMYDELYNKYFSVQ